LRRKENESLLGMMERWRMEEEGGQKVIEIGGESWKISEKGGRKIIEDDGGLKRKEDERLHAEEDK
jgi:hypothetical protein